MKKIAIITLAFCTALAFTSLFAASTGADSGENVIQVIAKRFEFSPSQITVKKGEPVQTRQPVIVIEAMKMENELRALVDGTLAEIHVQDGQSVEAGALLAVIHR